MPKGVCDGCGEEPDTFMVSNTENGQTQGFGIICLFMLGATTLHEIDRDAMDAGIMALGYEVSAAEQEKRAAKGDQSTSPQGDQSADGLVDKEADVAVSVDDAGLHFETFQPPEGENREPVLEEVDAPPY